MNEPETCPGCGLPLATDAPAGLCLNCLARLGAAGHGSPVAEGRPAEPLTLPADLHYFGDYELIEELGRGGMGVVYRARQVSLDRFVAIKTISAGPFPPGEFLGRFRLEAEMIARLNHPGIVAIHEVGEHAGQPYFAMEFVPGTTLAALARERPVPAQQAARLVAAVARAIQHAHDRGVLHRDLKPTNVLVDEAGEPRVTDFGIAKRIDGPDGLTLTGETLGTPGYISPEQIAARRNAVTVRSDVYSLGAILYYLLTARPPFVADTPAAVFHAVLTKDPVAPSGLNASVSTDLETICLHCLAKDPRRRYARADLLAEDLESWLAGRPIQARPVRAPERTWLWCRRNPLPALLGAALLLSLVTGLIGVAWEWRVAEGHREVADSARAAMQATTLRVERRQAEAYFDDQRSSEGLATLASALRTAPGELATSTRLVSALTHRSFALPISPPLEDGSPILTGQFNRDRSRLVTLDAVRGVRLWDARTAQPVGPPMLHSNEIVGLGFSRDGASLMIAVQCQGVWFRDAGTGALIGPDIRLPEVSFADLSWDNAWIVAGLTNGHLVVIRRDQPEQRLEWVAHSGNVSFIECSREGRRLASQAGSEIRVWNLMDPPISVAGVITNATGSMGTLSPDGRLLLTCEDSGLHLRALPTGDAVTNLVLPSAPEMLMFSPDSARFAVCLGDGTIQLRDARTGMELVECRGQTRQIWGLDFRPDGLELASGSQDGTARVWDTHTGLPLIEPIRHPYWVRAVGFSPGGEHLLTVSLHQSVHLWDVRPGASLPRVLRAAGPVRNAVFSPDGQELLTLETNGTVEAWNPRDGTRRRRLRAAPEGGLSSGFCDPAGRWLALADGRNRFEWLDLQSGATTPLEVTSTNGIGAADRSPDGRWIAVACDAELFLCDEVTGRRVATLNCAPRTSEYGHRFYSVRFSPDGRHLVAGCNDRHARLWEIGSGAVLADLPHDGPVFRAEFSGDGQRMLTASSDGTARIWQTTAPATPPLILREADEISQAVFSPDGRRVLIGTFDGTAALRDAMTGARLGARLRHRSLVRRCAFDLAGDRALTVSDDGTFRQWDARSSLPIGERIPLPAFAGSENFTSCAIAPDWSCFAGAAGVPEVSIWPDEPPLGPAAPDWLPGLAEAVAGLRYDVEGTEQVVDPSVLPAIRKRLELASDRDPWVRWARWFLADRGQRTASWPDGMASREFADAAIRSGEVKALRLVVQLQPTNAAAVASLARATLTETNNPAHAAESQFLARRAVQLESGSSGAADPAPPR